MAKIKPDSEFPVPDEVDKLELDHRFSREKRKPEVDAFRQAYIKQCRAQGMSRELAAKHAWAECARQFPPLPEPAAEDPVEEEPEEERTVKQQELPWKDLPGQADYEAEVLWVYQQYAIVVVERSAKSAILAWDQATEVPPSMAAVGLMKWASKNQTKFYDSMVPKIMAKKSDQDEEIVKREKLAVEKIEEMLVELEERFRERGVCPNCSK